VRFHSLAMVLCGAIVAGTIPSVARAQDPVSAPGEVSAASAKDLFERGRDLRGRGDCAGALPLFQKAYALYPLGLGSLRNIAVCEEALSRFASARDSWLELKRAVAANNDSKYAGWNEDADRAVSRLAPKVARLTTDLTVLSPGGDPTPDAPVDVTIDGQPLARDRVGVAIEHDPGTYVVRASGAGVSAPDQQTILLAAGDNKRVALRVTASPPLASSSPSADASAPALAVAPSIDHQPSASPMRTAGWIALGLGGAGLAGAVASFVVRESALSDLKESCPQYDSGPCAPSSRSTVLSDVNRGKTASTLLTVFGAVGVVGAITGVALVTSSRSHPAQAALVLTPTGVGAAGTF
jgi:hypothetical protein